MFLEKKKEMMKQALIKLGLYVLIKVYPITEVFKKMKKKIIKFLKISAIVISATLLLVGWTLYFTGNRNVDSIYKSKVINKSYVSYQKYRHISSFQLHLKMFMASNLNSGSNDKILFDVLNKMGANLSCSDSKIFIKQINAYNELGLISYISVVQARTGDIIIFKPTWRGQVRTQRLGLIQKIARGWIEIIENDETGIVFSRVSTNSEQIQTLVEFSYPIWAGVALYNGMRVTRGMSPNHDGYDLKLSNLDRSVFSFTKGEVISCYTEYSEELRYMKVNLGGNSVKIEFIENGKKYYLSYLHLMNIKVKVGDKITKDTLLGQYADIGYSFGAHLHLMLKDDNGSILDPLRILELNSPYILYGRDLKNFYVQLFNSDNYFKS
jgi:hypothetical protein